MANGNKISALDIVEELTGGEWLELIQPDSSSTTGYTNRRVSISDITDGSPIPGPEGPEGPAGVDGQSAYEVAVANGFEGTEAQWLESLVGKSAYDLAVELGYEGTEQEWLTSLQGLSAYQVAVQEGFEGTVSEWLESLKGEEGPEGPQGIQGIQGEQGEVGPPGPVDSDQLQLLLNERGYTVKHLLKVLDANGAVTANSGLFNFLFLFDKRIEQALEAVDKDSQYMVEMGRMEAEGYSYWKNEVGNGTTPPLPGIPDSEIRLYDDGRFQIGSLTDYVEMGNGSLITVFAEGVATDYDLSNIAEGAGIGGGVFITDILPTSGGNVGDKVFDEDGVSLLSCTSTGTEVMVALRALTGHSSYRPVVKINGETVPLTEVGPNIPMFQGTLLAEIVDGKIVAEHADGAMWEVSIIADVPPVIETTEIVSGYPGSQTELKENDTLSITVTADEPITGYEVANFGIFKAAANNIGSPGTTVTINGLAVADRGTTTQTLGYRVRIQKANGSWSDWVTSTDLGNGELEHVAQLNNLYPTVTIGSVEYPSGQTALKGQEEATVPNSVSDYDTVTYSSNGQLSITDASVFQPDKVVARVGGGYNITTNNFTITALREANGATTTRQTVVHIADALPTITVTTPAARLRSGGAWGTQAQLHTITITSNQRLASAPSLNAPEGEWTGAGFTGNAAGTVWTRQLRVDDDMAKGTFSWNSLTVESLSGQEQSEISGNDQYVLGGFVFRQMTVDAFPNREVAIGTQVVDTAKLRCSNLSKGAAGSLNFSYQATTDNAVDRYTITGPSGEANPTGDLWYNADGANASSNTGGSMTIELEEVI